ncbi:aldehyde dehydrogenase family protein [Xanthomonadaceae bacterium JHOS43]|nr:aldehyde dehydrogenase family protein [Xanthomonadaceae bacterium JHOS43]
MTIETAQVLIGSGWRDALGDSTFRAFDPDTGEACGDAFPVATEAEIEDAVRAAVAAAPALAAAAPETVAAFLERYADGIEREAGAIIALAHRETALPSVPRLSDNELPRTVCQLRQAAVAARERSWTQPVIDTRNGLRSSLGPLCKPVVVFGPNNFPLAYNAIAGSDFACAIAARSPVIAKVHPCHPGTSRALAKIALQAARDTGLPDGSVQMLYQLDQDAGLALCGDARIGAIGFTGSRAAGLALKAAADRAGIPFFGELSAVNPVVLLPGALAARGDDLAEEFLGSCLAGSGQMCTNPGVVIVPQGAAGDAFVAAAGTRFAAAAPVVVLSEAVLAGLEQGVQTLVGAGARVVAGEARRVAPGFRFTPTLLDVSADVFLQAPRALQTEAFGPVSLIVRSGNEAATFAIVGELDGSLTGSIHADAAEADVAERLAARLRPRVGRLNFNRMPTGVIVSPAMNHGGPYPSSTAPGFSAVGMPGAIRRFAQLQCYDRAPDGWLPAELTDANPHRVWRVVDGVPSRAPL